MFIYYGKTFHSSQAGVATIGVVCDQCQCTYYYELSRIGTGAHTASYGIGEGSAADKAQDQSASELQERLAVEAELVPCPKCNWISNGLVNGYRLGRYRGLGNAAFIVGFVGSALSLIVAWIFANGSQMDRWLWPYFLIGGPAACIGFGGLLLLFRRWLRSRIQPNSKFPSEPRLPPGTPPALLLDEATQTLKPASSSRVTGEDILDFQYGRSALPRVCCRCLQPSEDGKGYPIQITHLVHIEIPRCAACGDQAGRESKRISMLYFLAGSLINGFIVYLMVQQSLYSVIVVLSSLGLLAVTLVVMAFAADKQTSPVKKIGGDSDRGVVRLRFRNPALVEAVLRAANTATPTG
jgi:hypothetical protein